MIPLSRPPSHPGSFTYIFRTTMKGYTGGLCTIKSMNDFPVFYLINFLAVRFTMFSFTEIKTNGVNKI